MRLSVKKLRLFVRKCGPLAAAFALSASRAALAQSYGVGGGVTNIDPTTGLAALVAAFVGLCGIAMVGIAAFKGVKAYGHGEPLGPILAYGMAGLAMTFGGSWILTKYGVSALTTIAG